MELHSKFDLISCDILLTFIVGRVSIEVEPRQIRLNDV